MVLGGLSSANWGAGPLAPTVAPRFGRVFQQNQKPVVCLGTMLVDNIVSVQMTPDVFERVGNQRQVLGGKFKAEGPMKKSLGGGAINVSVNLKHLGFHPKPLSRIAQDAEGKWVLNQLKHLGVDGQLVQVAGRPEAQGGRFSFFKKHDTKGDSTSSTPLGTGYSSVVNYPGVDRLIVSYYGEAEKIDLASVDWNQVRTAQGVYIANAKGEDPQFLQKFVERTRALNPKATILLNPGKFQLAMPLEQLKPVLAQLDILVLNRQEGEQLAKVPSTTPMPLLLETLKSLGPRWVMVTDGKNGVYGIDQDYLYEMPAFKVDVKSTVGAGDAFASTLMASLMENPKDVPRAMYRASAQSASCIQVVGATEGLQSQEALARWEDTLRQTQPNVKVILTPRKSPQYPLLGSGVTTQDGAPPFSIPALVSPNRLSLEPLAVTA